MSIAKHTENIKKLVGDSRAYAQEVRSDYYHWLKDKITESDQLWCGKHYHLLLQQLFSTEFYWVLDKDENRAVDGRQLRILYGDADQTWITGPCTVLELLIGIAIRMDDILFDPDHCIERINIWFWGIIENLQLDKFDDEHFLEYGGSDKIDEILKRFMDRKYDKYGNGGLFPIKNTKKDQRNKEIWYQMNEYILAYYYIP